MRYVTVLPDGVQNVHNPSDNQNKITKTAHNRNGHGWNYRGTNQYSDHNYEQEPKNRRSNATLEKLSQTGNEKRRDAANQFANLFSHNEILL